MADKLKWGILGTGMIAKKFAEALGHSATGELLAVGSRKPETAEAFGTAYHVPRRYGSYEAFLADRDLDAVYISLPNHLHLQGTDCCAAAGKHILCEKPLAVNRLQAEALIDAARRRNVFLMEAFMYRCHPQTAKLVELVRSGAIGEVRLIQASFSYNMGTNPKPLHNIRLQNTAAGGGIMDVGCYTVSMARLLAGAALGMPGPAEPLSVSAAAHVGADSRVDEWSAAVAKFPGDIVASLNCGCMLSADAPLRLWGSQGNIEVANPWFPGRAPESELIVVRRAGKPAEEVKVPSLQGRLYALQADVLAEFRDRRQAPSPCMTWEDSLGNMRALDLWRQSVGLVFDAERNA